MSLAVYFPFIIALLFAPNNRVTAIINTPFANNSVNAYSYIMASIFINRF